LVRLPLLLALVVLAVALTPAAAEAKLPKEFFGITMAGPTDFKDLNRMRKIKVRTMRLSLNWRRTEPSRGNYRFDQFDARIANFARDGIRAAPAIYGAPAWATGSGYEGVPPLAGKAKKAFKRFLKKAVRRYKPGGVFWRNHRDVPRKPIKSWQIWNEPNLPKYFARKGVAPVKLVKNAPRKYAKLVRAADKAINRADKRAKVVLAGLSGNPKKKKELPHKFLKKFLKVPKAKKSFNAAALHPYAKNMRQYKSRLKKVRKAMDKKGAKKKDIWMTEVGWGSGPKDRFGLNKGLKGQARMLKKSFKLTLKKRKRWNIERVYWFYWRDHQVIGEPACSFCPYSGVLRLDRSKKPAYRQFKKFTRKQGRRGGRR
jgi:hypothetical protein